MNIFNCGFFTALAFLTRLGPALRAESAPFSRAIAWFFPVGLLLGVICLAAATVFSMWLSGFQPLAAALAAGWIWVCVSVWLTRALHWDGLGDITDALGSGAGGEKFLEILKDSRLGSFGAMAILLTAIGQWLGVSLHLSRIFPIDKLNELISASCVILLLAPAWSRLSPQWLALICKPYSENSLGGAFSAAISAKTACQSIFWGIVCLFLLYFSGCDFFTCVVLLISQIGLVVWLGGHARRHGGISGDYLGAVMELSQTLFIIVALG